jgi:hypothetical protein
MLAGKTRKIEMRTYLNRSRIGSLALYLFLLIGAASVVAEEKSSEQWQYDFEIYGWLPNIYVTTASQDHITLTLGDLLSNLKWMTMVDFGARKDKWSFNADVIYLHIGDHIQETTGGPFGRPETLDVEVSLKGFISTLSAGYQIAGNDRYQLDIIAGARYLNLELPLTIDIDDKSESVDPGGNTWDAIVGVSGVTTLNDKWYVDYYGDIGTGDSDLTWETRVGIGYKFKKFTGTAGLRYQRWNFDKKSELDNLRVLGPYVGAKWFW